MNQNPTIRAGADFHGAFSNTVTASSRLMAMLFDQLPDTAQEQIVAVVTTGGRIGVETTVDHGAMPCAVLVCIDSAGGRRYFTTAVPQQPLQ